MFAVGFYWLATKDRPARRHAAVAPPPTHNAVDPRSVDVDEFDEWEAFAPYPDHALHAAYEANAESVNSYPPFGRREEPAHAPQATDARHDLHDAIESLMGEPDKPAPPKPATASSSGPTIRCPRCLSSRIDTRNRARKAVRPDDLRAYDQCHFFAGIGVWSYALRRAGWPDDRPVWTGSCPCQPFSAAGKGAGFDDERHLWPAWYWLISECRPPVIFGEQVASSAVDPWIDLVHADVEAVDYAFACEPFPSAGVGAPHIRDRAFWLAHADRARVRGRSGSQYCAQAGSWDRTYLHDLVAGGAVRRLADSHIDRRPPEAGRAVLDHEHHAQPCGRAPEEQSHAGPTNGFWRAADWLLCRDGKWRPVESGTFPLADGAPARVGRLRAYGNAINAEAATQFILAAREILTI
nr:DNA cytosine methyltransferase [Burkholderia multivorans]